jgi:hypothetical protein
MGVTILAPPGIWKNVSGLMKKVEPQRTLLDEGGFIWLFLKNMTPWRPHVGVNFKSRGGHAKRRKP